MGGRTLIVGITFIIVGIFIYANENYFIEVIDGERILKKKKEIYENTRYRYKIMVSIFSIILGVYRIISWIIY